MKLKLSATVLATMLLHLQPAFAQQSYTVTTIVVPSAPFGSTPVALSQDGWVVGNVPVCCAASTAWLWRPDSPNGTSGSVKEFDFRGNGVQGTWFTAVNGGSIAWYYQVVGLSGTFGLVSQVDATNNLANTVGLTSCLAPDWGPNYGSQPYGINVNSDVAGVTGCPQDTDHAPLGFIRAAAWLGGVTLAMTPQGQAYAINRHGTITGTSSYGLDDNSKPGCTTNGLAGNCYDPYGLAFIAAPGGFPQYIPGVYGTAGCGGNAINDANEVAGGCITHPENGGGPRAFFYSNGQMIPIGCDAAGQNCIDATANGINNQSIVVGSMSGGGFIWDRVSGIRLLNTLAPGTRVDRALAINDAGQILAVCTDPHVGYAQPCVLTPAPTADLSASASGPATVTFGDQITYSINVSNGGPNAATGVTVSDTLPSTVSLVSANASQGSCSGTTTITCSIGALANNATATVTVVVSTTSAGTATNTVSVIGDQADASTGNNASTVITVVNKKAATIAWSPATPIVYGTALSGAQLNATADVAGAFVYSPAAGTVLHAGSQTLQVTFTPTSTNYDTATASTTLAVNPASLTVAANNQSTVYGAPLPPLTASYSGFVNGDTPASLTTAPTVSTPSTATSPAGSYPITAAGAVDSDYAIGYIPGSLTVGRASTTVSLTSGPNPSSAGQLVTFVASVAVVAPGAGSPGGAVAFSDGSVAIGSAQVDGNGTASFSTTALTAGTHHVTATYSGDTNFVGSTSSPISQVVNAVVQTSTIADLIAKVRTLNLNGGQKNSLIAKLQAAQASLDRGNTTAAANQLGAFINEVHADEQSGKLTTTDGDPLAAAAQTIAAGL